MAIPVAAPASQEGQDGSARPAGRSTFFNADLPPSHGGNTSQAQLATSLWAHNDCMQPLRPPEGVLTDGVVSLRVPSVEDVGAFVSYAAGHAGRGL